MNTPTCRCLSNALQCEATRLPPSLTLVKKLARPQRKRKANTPSNRPSLRMQSRPGTTLSLKRKLRDSRCARLPRRPTCTGRESAKSSGADNPAPVEHPLQPCYAARQFQKRRPATVQRDGPPDHKEAVLLMADRNPTDCGEFGPTDFAANDAEAERVVLAFLLQEHPSQLTIPELCRALYAHPGDFSSGDAVERAVRELDGAGLLCCRGGFVVPTRAALYFARLELD